MKFIYLLVLGLMVSRMCYAGVYKWVDDEGNTHFGDTIPPEYRDSAKSISGNFSVVESRQTPKLDKPKRGPLDALGREVELPKRKKPVQKKPPKKPEPNSCAAQWARYQESVACFGMCSTRNFGGGLDNSGCRCSAVKKPQCDLR